MLDSLYIAWRHVSFNKAKIAPLVVCVALVLALPLFLHLLSQEVERQALSHPGSVPAGTMDSATPIATEAAPSGLKRGDSGPATVSAESVNRLIRLLVFIVGVVAVLLLGLALRITWLLRATERYALYKLGCPRATMARQVALEILMVALASGALCALLLLVAHYFTGSLAGVLLV